MFDDWPLGGGKRGRCEFRVVTDPKRGQRVERTTTGKPKVTTYSDLAAVVDGDSGRTYLLHYGAQYGRCVTVMSSDMRHNVPSSELGHDHYITAIGNTPLFDELLALVKQAQEDNNIGDTQ